jgi:hypothetical protein
MQQGIVNQAPVDRILKTLQMALFNPAGNLQLDFEVVEAERPFYFLGSDAGFHAIS